MDPWEVIERVPLLRQAQTLEIQSLEGGLTNINHLVTADSERFVLRIAGANGDALGIDRQRESRCLARAEEAGIAPHVIAFLPEGHLVTRFLEGANPFTPEEFTGAENVSRVARLLSDVHRLDPVEGRFDPYLDIDRWTKKAAGSSLLVDARFDRLMDRAQETRLAEGGVRTEVLCHNDPYYLNFLDDGRLRLIDWEYAGMGDPFYDLAGVGYLLDAEGRVELISNYGVDISEQAIASLEAMIAVYLCWNAAWTLVQNEASSIDFDYDGFFGYLLDRAEAVGVL